MDSVFYHHHPLIHSIIILCFTDFLIPSLTLWYLSVPICVRAMILVTYSYMDKTFNIVIPAAIWPITYAPLIWAVHHHTCVRVKPPSGAFCCFLTTPIIIIIGHWSYMKEKHTMIIKFYPRHENSWFILHTLIWNCRYRTPAVYLNMIIKRPTEYRVHSFIIKNKMFKFRNVHKVQTPIGFSVTLRS